MWGIRLTLLGYLLVAAVADWKTKRVSVPFSVAAGIAACAIHLFEKDGFLAWAPGCLPGIFLFLVAYLTRQAVGYGDACVLAVIGLFLGFSQTVGIFVTALLLLCPVSLICLIWKRSRKYQLPFVPFYLAAYGCWLAGEIV